MAENEKMDDEEKPRTEAERDAEILEDSREGLTTCIEYEQDQREKMKDDLRFAVLDQWPEDIRTARENDILNGPRPCLTIDQINQYITQVANDMRANRPSIKTRPIDDKGDPETSKIFQGLIRHIEDLSSAQIAYQTSGESAVTIGLGYWRIVSEYVDDISSDQELVIKRVPDTFSAYLSRHIMPDGSDADKGWVFERMSKDAFKREYPKASVKNEDFAGLGEVPQWISDDDIIVCEYYYKDYEEKEVLYLDDGEAVYADDYEKSGDTRRIMGRRATNKVTIKWVKHTGAEILEKQDMKGKYIPIVEEVGKEKMVDGKRLLWGVVRPAKDSLRAFNYWISALTEKMALTPKAPFIGAVGQFASQGDQWDAANKNNYAKLEYDPIEVAGNVVAAPRRQEPMQMEPAMVQMLTIMQNNVKSSLGMYKASIGDTDSQQSGKAILALKRESDTGTMHFGDNQAISITHCGRILVDLIPHYYDTKRVIRILGEDDKPQNAMIDPNQKEPVREVRDQAGNIQKIYNLSVGRYDVTVTTGPGYTTSRQEAATVMNDLANTAKDPISAAILRYGTVKNSDFHGSEEITDMLKAMLPPQLQQQDGQDKIPPAAMQKIQQMQQEGQLLQQKLQEMAQENQQLKSGAQEAQSKIAAKAQESKDELDLKSQVQAETLRLERERVEAEIDLKRRQADADFEIAQRKAAAEEGHKTRAMEFDHQSKLASDPAYADVGMMPQVMGSIEQMAQGITQAFDQLAQLQQQSIGLQQQTLEAILKPKTVSIGGVRKDDSGQITGATVSTSIN